VEAWYFVQNVERIEQPPNAELLDALPPHPNMPHAVVDSATTIDKTMSFP
jgi:hypothetical protein